MQTQPPSLPTDRRPRIVELVALVYLAALIYASLYPWSGWRSVGLSGFDFLSEPWPRYWTWFDLLSNVVMYLPVGILLALLARERLQPKANVALVLLIGVCLSGSLEALQTFLPGRVPSKLDWLANGFGTLLGAAGLALFQPRSSDRNALVWHRPLLLRPDSAAMLIMVAIWLLAQTVPQRLLFETGGVVQPLIDLLRVQAAAAEVDPQAAPMSAQLAAQLAPWLEDLRVSSDYAVMIEAAEVAAWMAAVGLMMTDAVTASARRSILVGAVLLAALLIRSASATWLFDGTELGLWLSAGAQGGLVVGAVVLTMLSTARHRTRLWLIVLLLAAGIVLTNVFPPSVYQDAAVSAGEQGAWRNFHALMRAVALLWPFAALLTVALAIHPLRWRRSL